MRDAFIAGRQTGKAAALITELTRQLVIARAALDYIATSYPETDEGETLAAHARAALSEMK